MHLDGNTRLPSSLGTVWYSTRSLEHGTGKVLGSCPGYAGVVQEVELFYVVLHVAGNALSRPKHLNMMESMST